MKKQILILIFLASLVFSCTKDDFENRQNQYTVKVLYDDKPVPGATVIAITNSNEEIIQNVGNNGVVKINSTSKINKICGVSLGLAGVINLDTEKNATIKLSEYSDTKLKSVNTEGTFGVYSTDENGDVSFRYIGIFQNYYCTSWLMWLGISTNPNNWDGWDLTDWLPSWKGKKLLVPTRYQEFHQSFYGYPINQALFLTSIY